MSETFLFKSTLSNNSANSDRLKSFGSNLSTTGEKAGGNADEAATTSDILVLGWSIIPSL